ncbi:unnamed protein product [Meganyctiphanes norvegica]|uniref:Immunoglobulin domain-containing protein n=1 Tax=Meganyctiphanes norvegica TaxID=48144 RepID=A0AAV2QFH1_MEGNR
MFASCQMLTTGLLLQRMATTVLIALSFIVCWTHKAQGQQEGGLQLTRVAAKTPLVVGDDGWLECEWDVGTDTIYSVKWYQVRLQGLQEFYRWTPADEKSPVKLFPVSGLTVDPASVRGGHVRIHNVGLEAEGTYRCEVSAEAPTFHTQAAVVEVKVIDLPDSAPRMAWHQTGYRVHDLVMVNCSSPRARPPPTLSFYVNDEPVDPLWLLSQASIVEPNTGLETAVLTMRFLLHPRLLSRGQGVRIKCTAEVGSVYWESSEEHVPGDQPYHGAVIHSIDEYGRITYSAASNPAKLSPSILLYVYTSSIFMVYFIPWLQL